MGLHNDIVHNSSGAEVTFDATVLDNPVESGGHERFDVKATTGESLEIDHNTTLATYAPIRAGDKVVIHGQLYIDPGPRLRSALHTRMPRRRADAPTQAGSNSKTITTNEREAAASTDDHAGIGLSEPGRRRHGACGADADDCREHRAARRHPKG